MTTLVSDHVDEWLYDAATRSVAPVLYVDREELRYDVPLDPVIVGRWLIGDDASPTAAYAAAADASDVITEAIETEYGAEVWWEEEFRVVFPLPIAPEEFSTLTLEEAGERIQTASKLELFMAHLDDEDTLPEFIRAAVQA